MTLQNHGSLHLLDGKVTDRAFWDVLAKHDLNFEEMVKGAEVAAFEIREYPGDIEDRLKAAVADLYEKGYRLEGSVSYFGDYEGSYDIQSNGAVRAYSLEETNIRDAGDAELIAELESRGYTVQKQEMTMEL